MKTAQEYYEIYKNDLTAADKNRVCVGAWNLIQTMLMDFKEECSTIPDLTMSMLVSTMEEYAVVWDEIVETTTKETDTPLKKGFFFEIADRMISDMWKDLTAATSQPE